MKALAFLLLLATTATFASSGIIWVRHYTVTTKTQKCAIDVVKLDTGRIVSEKICFPISK